MEVFTSHCEECPSCLECSKRSPVFNQLDEADLIEINRGRYEVSYSKSDILFKQGAPMSHFLSLTEGYVALALEAAENKQQILKICKPYELIGGLGLFNSKRYQYTAIALSDVKVCYLDGQVFLPLVHRNPVLSKAYFRQIALENQSLHELLISVTSQTLKERIAKSLLELTSIQNPINLDIFDAKVLAMMVNGAKDNVVRTLKEWEKQKILSSGNNRNRITILDKTALLAQ